MADTKISAETAASALGGTEVTEGVQSGANVKITAAQIKTFASASPTITGHATIEGVTATGATGTGKFVFDGTPTLVTPVLGVATGTSLALNGATLGTNKLAVTGTTLLTGAVTGTSSLTLGVASSATGSLVLANTGSAFATTIQAGNNAAARTYVWPTNFGAAGTVLTDASGDGTLSWGAIPSGTITANSTLTSGLTAGQLLYSDATKIQASAGLTVAANSLTIGTASSASGSLVLLNSANAYTTTLQASASTAASRTYVLPVNFGASGSVLTDSAGNGILSWATAPAAALTVGSTAISSGTTTRILYDNAGTLGEYTTTGSGTEVALSTSPTFITGLTSPVVTLGAQQTTQGSLVLANTAAGAYATTIQSSNSATAAVTYTLPPAVAGAAGYVLTDVAGNGVLSWAAGGGGLTVNTTTISGGAAGQLLFTDGSKLQASNLVQGTNILTLANGSNNQRLNVCELFTSASVYQGVAIAHNICSGAGWNDIVSIAIGGSTNVRGLALRAGSNTSGATGGGAIFLATDGTITLGNGGADAWKISKDTPYSLLAVYDGSPSIGAAGATRPKDLFLTNYLHWGGQAKVTVQFDKTSDAALANIPGLTVTLVAAKTYSFNATLYTASDAAGGVQAAIGGTATATSIIYEGELVNSSTVAGQTKATALGTAVAAVTAVTAARIEICGTIVCNAGGTLTVQFAQNVSNGTASSVLVGSTFNVHEF